MERIAAGGLQSLRDANRRLVIQALRAPRRSQPRGDRADHRAVPLDRVEPRHRPPGVRPDRRARGRRPAGRAGRPPAGADRAVAVGRRRRRHRLRPQPHRRRRRRPRAHRARRALAARSTSTTWRVEGLDTAAELVDAVAGRGGRRARPGDRRRHGPAGPDLRRSADRRLDLDPARLGRRQRDARRWQRRLGIAVSVENDANLGALAEHVWGAGRGADDVAYIKASSGIGAGLVLGGRLHRGIGGTAGEIGHTHFREEGVVCRCGNRGCLETDRPHGRDRQLGAGGPRRAR